MTNDPQRPNNLSQADIKRLRERYAPWLCTPPRPELPIAVLVDTWAVRQILKTYRNWGYRERKKKRD